MRHGGKISQTHGIQKFTNDALAPRTTYQSGGSSGDEASCMDDEAVYRKFAPKSFANLGINSCVCIDQAP